MQIGAISTLFLDQPLCQAARKMRGLGLETIEIPTGGFYAKSHCDPARLIAEPSQLAHFQETLSANGLEVSAFAIHGRPLHPDPAIAQAYDREFRDTCALAAEVGVTRLTLLAGLPAAAPGDRAPNWITVPMAPQVEEMLEWQWQQKTIPYWKERARVADDHGVRLCFEMVPADMVYNPETFLRLRHAIGPVAGCNLDPSHLFWQGIDTLEATRVLGEAIYHVHAKDSRIDEHNVRVNGVLDAKSFEIQERRSWLFRTVGFGHGEEFWRNFLTTLRLVGYDDAISIEHEDPLIDPQRGLELAVKMLRNILI